MDLMVYFKPKDPFLCFVPCGKLLTKVMLCDTII